MTNIYRAATAIDASSQGLMDMVDYGSVYNIYGVQNDAQHRSDWLILEATMESSSLRECKFFSIAANPEQDSDTGCTCRKMLQYTMQ